MGSRPRLKLSDEIHEASKKKTAQCARLFLQRTAQCAVSAIVIASSNAQVARAFQVGDQIENFGAVCVVESVDAERGLLVKILPVIRRGVRQGGAFQRYYANPAKCEHVSHFVPCF